MKTTLTDIAIQIINTNIPCSLYPYNRNSYTGNQHHYNEMPDWSDKYVNYDCGEFMNWSHVDSWQHQRHSGMYGHL